MSKIPFPPRIVLAYNELGDPVAAEVAAHESSVEFCRTRMGAEHPAASVVVIELTGLENLPASSGIVLGAVVEYGGALVTIRGQGGSALVHAEALDDHTHPGVRGALDHMLGGS